MWCDWPGCDEQTELWFKNGWHHCGSHADISFLPDPCLLCPKHGEMYEEIACDPNLLYPGDDEDDEDEDDEDEVGSGQ
jgi:hypothetical protein